MNGGRTSIKPFFVGVSEYVYFFHFSWKSLFSLFSLVPLPSKLKISFRQPWIEEHIIISSSRIQPDVNSTCKKFARHNVLDTRFCSILTIQRPSKCLKIIFSLLHKLFKKSFFPIVTAATITGFTIHTLAQIQDDRDLDGDWQLLLQRPLQPDD